MDIKRYVVTYTDKAGVICKRRFIYLTSATEFINYIEEKTMAYTGLKFVSLTIDNNEN